jgi:hypothetical protein
MVDSPPLLCLGLFEKKKSEEPEAKRNVKVGEWVPIQAKKKWTLYKEQSKSQKKLQSL